MDTNNQRTPVLIAVGQFTNRGETSDDIFCPADLAAVAVNNCLDQLPNRAESDAIDTVAVCRLFSDTSPAWRSVFGGSDNLPRSIASRAGLDPATAIYAETGGQSPQALINEQCERIHSGDSRAALIVGVEAIRSYKRAMKQGLELDWNESPGGSLDNRSEDKGMAMGYEYKHGIGIPIQTYSLFEHAIRGQRGDSVAQHQRHMAELFAPFSEVAAGNPYSQFPVAHSVEDLLSESGGNYRLTDMYTKNLVAQDSVDQAGALLVVSDEYADELGVPESQRVYLHGYGTVADTPIILRPELHKSRAMALAGNIALDTAQCSIADIDFFDIYSCFPSAVSCASDALGLGAVDPSRLTMTGGLPYFGGPGNSYSIHGAIEIVKALREAPGKRGLVLANGGYLSKISVGVYSTTRPDEWAPCDSAGAQCEIDESPSPVIVKELNGGGTIESYSVVYSRGEIKFAFVIGHTAHGARFMATARKGDVEAVNDLLKSDSIGRAVRVQNDDGKNYFDFA